MLAIQPSTQTPYRNNIPTFKANPSQVSKIVNNQTVCNIPITLLLKKLPKETTLIFKNDNYFLHNKPMGVELDLKKLECCTKETVMSEEDYMRYTEKLKFSQNESTNLDSVEKMCDALSPQTVSEAMYTRVITRYKEKLAHSWFPNLRQLDRKFTKEIEQLMECVGQPKERIHIYDDLTAKY